MEETIEFKAEGMHCPSCEKIIQKQALEVEGVKKCEIDYITQEGKITFDPDKTSIGAVLGKIEEKGYECFIIEDSNRLFSNDNWIGWMMGIIGLLVVGYFVLQFADGIQLPEIRQSTGYGLLFMVGLLTGLHCVSMCGGFVVSYTAKHAQERTKSYKSHLMYGLGKTISYTIIGATFGWIGSLIAFTPMMRGTTGILAGLFLILFGLKMLNIIPILRKIQIKTPKSLEKFIGKESKKHSSPLIIGLLNGLMIACGPLQAIYIMAAGTGSAIAGAKILFVFALGTLPVMLSFGYITSFISSKATHKILKFSGVIVIVLGLFMINNGLSLTGTGYDINTFFTSVRANDVTSNMASNELSSLKNGYQEIRMEVNRYGWEPDKFVLKKGVPVKWIINGKEINGCNNAIQVPKLGLKFDIKRGEQVIEFIPKEEGKISWSCWMGMIPGLFIVKEDIDLTNQKEIQKELDTVQVPQGGSCGGSCGSSTCGAARGGSCGCGG